MRPDRQHVPTVMPTGNRPQNLGKTINDVTSRLEGDPNDVGIDLREEEVCFGVAKQHHQLVLPVDLEDFHLAGLLEAKPTRSVGEILLVEGEKAQAPAFTPRVDPQIQELLTESRLPGRE